MSASWREVGASGARDAGCWPHYLLAQDKACHRCGTGSGHRWKLWSGALMRPDRRYRPDRPLSRVPHLHQACMDHPLEVARQRLQVDGPHPTAPSHPQAPSPWARFSSEFVPSIPALMSYRLRRSSVASVRRLDVTFGDQVRLQDVGPRTPASWATGSLEVVGKVDSTRSGASFSLHLDGRVAGGAHRRLLPCDGSVESKVRARSWSVTLFEFRRRGAHVDVSSPARGFEGIAATHSRGGEELVAVRISGRARERESSHSGAHLQILLVAGLRHLARPRSVPLGPLGHPGRIAGGHLLGSCQPCIPQHHRHRPWGARPGVCALLPQAAPPGTSPAGR